MATYEKAIATWSGGTCYARVNLTQGAQSAAGNYTDVAWSTQSRDTHSSVSGTWDYTRGGTIGASSGSVAAATGTRTIQSGTKRVTHDANGNGACSGSLWLDVYYGSGTASGTLTLSRIPLAPSGLTQTVTARKPTSLSISLDISSLGHGTSATHELQYKAATSGTWIGTPDQSITDKLANTFTVTGLKPNTLYDYRQRVWNNNGDTAYSTAAQVKTQGVAGHVPLLMGIM